MDERGVELDLSTLISMDSYDEDNQDVVTAAARQLFLNFVQSQDNVRPVFFPNVVLDNKWHMIENRLFPFSVFAVAYVAKVLINMKDGYKFYAMLNEVKVNKILDDCYESVAWKKIGFNIYALLYPNLVRDEVTGVSLQDYIDDGGDIWAERLLAEIRRPSWVHMNLARIVTGAYSEETYRDRMNDLFVKLHLLDPQAVLPAYHYLLSLRALPEVHLDLATRNYLGEAFSWQEIADDVSAAVNKVSNPLNSSMLSLTDVQLYYGIRVDDFISCECHILGLWTGKRPDNRRFSSVSERCRVM